MSSTKEMQDVRREIFERCRDKAVLMLCELRASCIKMGARPKVLTSAILTEHEVAEIRDTLADWVIIREYINQLQYLGAITKHLLANMPANKMWNRLIRWPARQQRNNPRRYIKLILIHRQQNKRIIVYVQREF